MALAEKAQGFFVQGLDMRSLRAMVGLASLLCAEQSFLFRPGIDQLFSGDSPLYPEAVAVPFMALFSLVFVVIGGKWRSVNRNRALQIGACICGIAGCVVSTATDWPGSALLATALFLLFSTTMLVAWMERLASVSSMGLRGVLVGQSASVLLGDFATSFLSYPLWAAVLLAALSVSLLLLDGSGGESEPLLAKQPEATISRRPVFGLLLVGFVMGCVQSSVAQDGTWNQWWNLGMGVLTLFLLWLFLCKVPDPGHGLALKVVLTLSFAALCLMLCFPGNGNAAFCLASSAFGLLWGVVYLIAIEVVRSTKQSPTRVFGVVGFMLYAGSVPVLWVSMAGGVAGDARFLGLLIGLLAGVTLWVFNDRSLDGLLRGSPESSFSAPSNVDVWNALAFEYGLTPREVEIAMLYTQGRSAPFIAEQLVLSESTVKSHLAHSYAKTGVHSRQELISLLEATEADNRPLSQ